MISPCQAAYLLLADHELRQAMYLIRDLTDPALPEYVGDDQAADLFGLVGDLHRQGKLSLRTVAVLRRLAKLAWLQVESELPIPQLRHMLPYLPLCHN